MKVEKVKGNILIVEDNPKTRKMIQRHLLREGYEITEAENGKTAIELIEHNQYDVILLDIMMPEMSGLDVCQILRSNPRNASLYIIMITAVKGGEEKVRGLDSGADDYLEKPFDVNEMLARIRVGLRTVKAKRDAIIDKLTQLYNRHFFDACIIQEMNRTLRYNRHLSLLIIDLDLFKRVNDTYGHDVGDSVLSEAASIINKMCRQSDYPVRWGGEEFVVLLPETNKEGAFRLAEKLRVEFEKHVFDIAGKVTASIGVASMANEYVDLIKVADNALYHAKSEGRNRVVVF